MKDSIEIKVCGMRDPDNIREVARLRPDYMGFIFYDKTPRYVGDDFIFPEGFPSTTRRVGVFVNASTQAIVSKVDEFKLDLVQLHGDETVSQCQELRRRGVGVIKAFSVDGSMDFTVTKPYKDAVDYFLFDTKGKFYGGNARTFDWSVLARYDQAVPFFLSGGITPENAEAIKELKGLNIQAIDVNSGVEMSPAFKDVEKIKAIKAILKF